MAAIDPVEIAKRWHAGEAGCGALIIGLKRQLARVQPGEMVEVTALDAAAAIDIAAWCEMTGHVLAAENHPTYLVRRRHRRSDADLASA